LSRQIHSRVVTRYFGEVWNQGRVELLDDLLHPNYINHPSALPGQPAGPEGLKRVILAMRMAFPDLRYDVRDEAHDGDRVAVRVVKRGTHEGNLFGIAPTGRRIEVEQMQVERFHEGKIIEHWRTTTMSNEERDKHLALQERLSTADPDCLTRHDNEFVLAMVLQIVQELADGHKEPAPGCDPLVVGQQLANFLLPSPPSSTELPGRVRECLRAAFSHDPNGENGANGDGHATAINGNPEMRDVARTLGVSPRTLQRRLQQVGSSFTHEVDCVRRELACQYLADTNRPLCAIALQLGFGEVGSFFRTFRRWTQTSPRRFRLHHTPRVVSA